MPCYQMNTLSLEFNAANLDYLQLALRELNILYEIVGEAEGIRIKQCYSDDIYIDLKNQRVECTRNQLGQINELKVEYSRQVIAEVAKRKRWVVQAHQKTKNKLKLRRF